MRIVIEIDGQKITAIGPEAAPGALAAPVPAVGDAPPGPPPPGLLERAKKLGAMSAGAAQFGTGAALAEATLPGKKPARAARPRPARAARKRTRRAR
jgi:hypothetical protein